jgi:carboxyl-terminal processing protease
LKQTNRRRPHPWLSGVSFLSLLLAALLAAACASAPGAADRAAEPAPPAQTAEAHRLDVESFDVVWTTIRDRFWDPELDGIDWEGVREELRPKIEAAESREEARGVLNEMISRLERTHFGIIPASAYLAMNPEKGEGSRPAGEGVTGIDPRVLDGQAVVFRVEPGSAAEEAGVKPGWVVEAIDGEELAAKLEEIAEAFADSTLRDYFLREAVAERLSGAVGGEVPVRLLDGEGHSREFTLGLALPRGKRVGVGHLPESHVWFESHALEGHSVGYVSLNIFLDPPDIMARFGEAVESFRELEGIVIDIRGNPGGLGAMAMGMSGWFVDTPGLKLGTMTTRETTLRFVVFPRANPYRGKVAVLVDGSSASTSEILAGGLKDLGRARIFGSRSAGAALPSVIETLPNDDRFQFALGDYLSEGGEHLEGRGVTPDEVVVPTREELLAGRDPALEAAVAWIEDVAAEAP